MRRPMLYLLCLLLLSSVGWAEANLKKKVTLSFKGADLVSVLETLATEMGAYSYIAPNTKGVVTVELRDVSADEAVRQVLASQKTDYAFVILDDVPVKSTSTLVVATPDELAELTSGSGPVTDLTRMEFILEEAPADKVMDFLKTQYINVEFIPHPLMNGFYARGPRAELLLIKSELRNLDWTWCPPPSMPESWQGPPNEEQSIRPHTGSIGDVSVAPEVPGSGLRKLCLYAFHNCKKCE